MKLITVGIISSTLICSNVIAKQCDVNFNYGVVIDPQHIRMLEHDKTYVQINGQNQLFVSGREISLTNKQRALLSQYTAGIRQQVPSIVSIAIEGVDIGLNAVNKVIGGLTGENSDSHQKFQKKFDDMQSRLRKRFNHSDNSYYIGAQDFDDFDEIFAGEFENEIEDIISDSIGSILMAVGETITNDDSAQNSEKRIDTFDERMTSMGKDLKLEISSRVNSLEQKSAAFCQKLIELDHIETELQQSIYQLLEFDLIKTSAE
ncbi:MAG: hypothetical protein ACI9LM_003284 [Alteromonadaceae bacterium]